MDLQIIRYYYDPDTGEFVGSTNNPKVSSMDYPYIERTQFFYSDYRLDTKTLELIHDPKPKNPRG